MAISPKPEWRHPSKLVCMLNTLTSTCLIFWKALVLFKMHAIMINIGSLSLLFLSITSNMRKFPNHYHSIHYCITLLVNILLLVTTTDKNFHSHCTSGLFHFIKYNVFSILTQIPCINL